MYIPESGDTHQARHLAYQDIESGTSHETTDGRCRDEVDNASEPE